MARPVNDIAMFIKFRVPWKSFEFHKLSLSTLQCGQDGRIIMPMIGKLVVGVRRLPALVLVISTRGNIRAI